MSAAEAAHQNAFLQALFKRSELLDGFVLPFDAGLAAYRNNGSANVVRAMALMFPAVHALLGEDDFAPLARLHWLAQPPQRGDWSQYGAGFGDWMAAHNPGGVLDALPFLPDLARLDDALSRCQDAADARADLTTLALLELDPSTLRMVLHPSVTVLSLAYELLDFRHAVLNDQPFTTPLANASHLLIARQGYRPQASAIAAPSAAFVSHCNRGATLLQAHGAAAAIDPNFDVSDWLSQAIAAHWILQIVRIETF